MTHIILIICRKPCTFRFYWIDFQSNTDFPSQFCLLTVKSPSVTQRSVTLIENNFRFFKIVKFEFKVTVHYSLRIKCTSCDPLTSIRRMYYLTANYRPIHWLKYNSVQGNFNILLCYISEQFLFQNVLIRKGYFSDKQVKRKFISPVIVIVISPKVTFSKLQQTSVFFKTCIGFAICKKWTIGIKSIRRNGLSE